MSNVVVIGGAGFIGSHCCSALSKAGYRPVVYDNLSTGHRAFVKWGPIIKGDIRDKECLATVLREFKPVGVIHLAALALVGPSVVDPGRYYDWNVGGTLRILEAMRDTRQTKLVFSSTCAVYGEPDELFISEKLPCNPVNPYGATKLTCERMIRDFGIAHQICSVRLRYFNAAGADPEEGIGERHDPETHLVPLVIESALQRRPELQIYGRDYMTPDRTAIRDYIHVKDLASAHLAALRHLIDGGDNQVLNIGSGIGTSILEVVKMVETVSGRHVRCASAPRREGDPARLVADARKAEVTLGWRPKCTLQDIIKDAWRWHVGSTMSI